MARVAVWASGPGTPTSVCEDARLTGEPGRTRSTSSGQAGWDLGVNFTTLTDLATKLSTLELPEWLLGPFPALNEGRWFAGEPARRIMHGEIRALAINAHGEHNHLRTSGSTQAGLRPSTMTENLGDLTTIGRFLAPDATVYLMGCVVVPPDVQQARLLFALSRRWSGRRMVGYQTVGYQAGGEMKRSSLESFLESCAEPGMRDGDQTSATLSQGQRDAVYGSRWNRVSPDYRVGLPWATEWSPHAVVVRSRRVTHVGGVPYHAPPEEAAWLDDD